jgi:hypothetical protein
MAATAPRRIDRRPATARPSDETERAVSVVEGSR